MSEQASLPLSDPSSSPAPAAQASPAPAAPAAASQSTPNNPAPAAAARPEGVPDSYWDTTANALKVDPTVLARDLKERDDLKAFKATEDSRRLTLPQNADGYKIELPADFKPPEGVTFQFKADDPLLVQAKALAHQSGMSQDNFSKMLSVYAAAQVQDQATISAAKQAEITKLGVNGPARVDAVTAWLKGVGGPDAEILCRTLDFAPVAGTVMAFERLMQKFSSQGGSGFTQNGRTQPDDTKIPGYDKMSFEQRRFAQDQLRARKTG